MRKATVISPAKYQKESRYEQIITLEDGLSFKFDALYFRTAEVWEVTFEDAQGNRYQSEKRKGAAIELFAALEKVFNDFIAKTLPNKFRFTADIDEKSRVKLYNTLAKKIAKKGLGYEYTTKQSPAAVIYKFKHWSVDEF